MSNIYTVGVSAQRVLELAIESSSGVAYELLTNRRDWQPSHNLKWGKSHKRAQDRVFELLHQHIGRKKLEVVEVKLYGFDRFVEIRPRNLKARKLGKLPRTIEANSAGMDFTHALYPHMLNRPEIGMVRANLRADSVMFVVDDECVVALLSAEPREGFKSKRYLIGNGVAQITEI